MTVMLGATRVVDLTEQRQRSVMPESLGWREPRSHTVYPFGFEAYRRAREREERWPARHQRLGHQVDRQQWREWTSRPASTAVALEIAHKVPPRIHRVIGAVLRSIRHGQSADQAIRQVSRRLRVKPFRVRAWIAANVQCRRRSLVAEQV
jgi:hypothetical protein